MAPAQVQGDFAFCQAGGAKLGRVAIGQQGFGQHQFGIEYFKLPPAKHRQRTVRRHAANGLVVIEIVAEFGYFGVGFVFACRQLALQQPFLPKPFAQALHQCGIFSPAFAQNIAHAIKHSGNGGEVFTRFAFFGFDKSLRLCGGVERGVGPEQVGQWLYAKFSGNLPFGAALGLVGQIQVFQLLLGGRSSNGCLQLGCEFALLGNAFDDGSAALIQLTQVTKPSLQFTQLNIVKPASGFFAITGNKRHSGSAVKQINSGLHLAGLHAQFAGNALDDGLHKWMSGEERK